jgi:hypothetical protein
MANNYEKRGPVSTSYSNGNKNRTYTTGSSYGGQRVTKTDTYSNNGGAGHGHKVKVGNGFTTFSRPGPRGTSSMSLGDILFGKGSRPTKKR